MLKLSDVRTMTLEARAPMSWFSRVEDAVIGLATGQSSVNTNIIDHPTTPVETAVNAAASVILPAAASLPEVQAAAVPVEAIKTVLAQPQTQTPAGAVQTVVSAVGQAAASATNAFLSNAIGTQNTALADAGAEALAAAAIAKMSASSNKTEAEIASALHDFLVGFQGTTPATGVATA